MDNEKNTGINNPKTNVPSGLPKANSVSSRKYMDMGIKRTINATSVHSLAQKSQTLYRRSTQKPFSHIPQLAKRVTRNMDIARSKSVSHFAPRSIAKSDIQTTVKQRPDIKPIRHPYAVKADKARLVTTSQLTRPPIIDKSLRAIKEEAITKAIEKPQVIHKKKSFFKKHSKPIGIISIIIAIIAIIGILTYFFIPNFSVYVASMKAGISATYPKYYPDGYSLDGQVLYDSGEVTIRFHANTGDTNFTIKQSKSSWDSTALKNKVNKDANGATVNTTQERGLTIYTYSNNAAWVNGGILYSITGNARLSNDQIRRIAVSL